MDKIYHKNNFTKKYYADKRKTFFPPKKPEIIIDAHNVSVLTGKYVITNDAQSLKQLIELFKMIRRSIYHTKCEYKYEFNKELLNLIKYKKESEKEKQNSYLINVSEIKHFDNEQWFIMYKSLIPNNISPLIKPDMLITLTDIFETTIISEILYYSKIDKKINKEAEHPEITLAYEICKEIKEYIMNLSLSNNENMREIIEKDQYLRLVISLITLGKCVILDKKYNKRVIAKCFNDNKNTNTIKDFDNGYMEINKIFEESYPEFYKNIATLKKQDINQDIINEVQVVKYLSGIILGKKKCLYSDYSKKVIAETDISILDDFNKYFHESKTITSMKLYNMIRRASGVTIEINKLNIRDDLNSVYTRISHAQTDELMDLILERIDDSKRSDIMFELMKIVIKQREISNAQLYQYIKNAIFKINNSYQSKYAMLQNLNFIGKFVVEKMFTTDQILEIFSETLDISLDKIDKLHIVILEKIIDNMIESSNNDQEILNDILKICEKIDSDSKELRIYKMNLLNKIDEIT